MARPLTGFIGLLAKMQVSMGAERTEFCIETSKIMTHGRSALFSALVVSTVFMCGFPVLAQDAAWVSKTFAALQHLVDARTALSATLYPAIDTELPKQGAGQIVIQISRNAPVGTNPVVPGGSRAICHYQPVRGGNRIPATCDRLRTPEGGDFKIKATVYGRDGLPGIPADGIKPNGALLADHAKELAIYLDEVVSVGVVGGPMWSKK